MALLIMAATPPESIPLLAPYSGSKPQNAPMANPEITAPAAADGAEFMRRTSASFGTGCSCGWAWRVHSTGNIEAQISNATSTNATNSRC